MKQFYELYVIHCKRFTATENTKALKSTTSCYLHHISLNILIIQFLGS